MSLASIPNSLVGEILTENDQSFCQQLKYIASHITVEPLVFLAILPAIMNSLTTQNLNLEKACRVNLQYNTSVCDAMVKRDTTGYEPFQENEVQKLVSSMVSIRMIITGSYPAFLMLFLGSWSDRYGRRKPLILIPLIGELIATILLFFCSYFFMELSVEYSMLAETIPVALGGTWACTCLGVYTYVSGLCNEKERTLRIGAVTMCQNISVTLGLFASGIAVNILRFKGVYAVSSILLSASILYGIFMIKENKTVNASDTKEAKNPITDFFSIQHIQNTFRICFKNEGHNRRSRMIAIMLLSALVMGQFHGEGGVIYLYTRKKFGWNEIDFSLYNSLHIVIQLIGSGFALAFFSKYLGFSDATLGMMSMCSTLFACLVYAFAPSASIFYIGTFLEVFHGTCHIALRSLMAKLVPPHELGQSNSVFALFEALTPLIFGPMYSYLYNASLTIFPGAFYFVSVGINIIAFYLFFWTYRTQKKIVEAKEQLDVSDKLLAVKEESKLRALNGEST